MYLQIIFCIVFGAQASAVYRRQTDQLEWTALGDFYASGVGLTNYVDGSRCLCCDEAYPVMLNQDSDFEPSKHIFNNCACSGAYIIDVSAWQLLDKPASLGPNFQYGEIKACS